MNSILPWSLVLLALGFAECVLSNPRQNASIAAIGTVNLQTGVDYQILFPNLADYTTQTIQMSGQALARHYPGSNNIDGGVLLALNSMKDYKVDNEAITLCHVATRPLLNPQGRRQQLRRSDKIPTTDILDAHISTTIQQFNETGIYDFVRASCNLVLADDDASTAAGVILTITYNVTTSRASAVILGVQEGIISPPPRFANFIAIPGTSKAHNVTTSKQWYRVRPSLHVRDLESSGGADRRHPGPVPNLRVNLSPASAASVAKTNQIGNTWGVFEEPLIWWQVTTGWDRAEDSLRVEAWVRHLVEHLHANNKRNNLAREFIYMGDAGEWQDPFVGFPAENVQRMRDIRQIYDPSGTFSRLNWGGFKLGY
ncbi:hypothetical protein AN2696.2 [Aspergillus nidulans FGSC A4]|uniref:FAD-binding PCMH-type domain-containing protein n=1 Tax=Emericella nidulans (strain FGSC A4 / ATCC 38163 / CBS 112.46 / NRRL 194 / M139) TaxID=227321 RepID=Q5B9T4_EMENI|nr:hypothetical protein [Aspergillus nidulans FGSC A4]EAA63098.1 hypothetical protein AN2696.2 [Aspergillus nidulans FGSC A4]CBF84193.1 TPA: conserved hypothetical protein [Aspergillus nidulans FGSC A4]|eukprot:XP_660300.1 hypothetical protein AN2696.2 [Aspergillus nidulans FGSC A4]